MGSSFGETGRRGCLRNIIKLCGRVTEEEAFWGALKKYIYVITWTTAHVNTKLAQVNE